MTTGATTLLGLALPVQGELSGAWGDVINNYMTQYLDSAIAGTNTLSADADVTLTKTTGASLTGTSSQYAVLLCTGSRAAQRTITAPATSKTYIVINSTTGGLAVKIVGAGPTTGITVANGTIAQVVWNGTDFIATSIISTTGVVPTATTAINGSPVGSVTMYSIATAPTGWLLANGASVSTTTYAALFAVVGYTFGGSAGSFSLPDYRDRMPVGAGTTYVATSTGGSKDSALPTHSHTISITSGGQSTTHTHDYQYSGNGTSTGGGAYPAAYAASTSATSANSVDHNHLVSGTSASTGVSPTNTNLPPYLGVYFIIKT